MRALGWLVFLAACTPPKGRSAEPAPHWERQTAERARVSFEALVNQPPQREARPDAEIISASAGPVWTAVYIGKDLTLASWTARNGSPGTLVAGRASICGEPAVTTIETRPGQSVEVHDPKNHWETSPSTTTVTVAFTHAGVGVVARWHVDEDERARLRASEDRFFGSFRCE